MTEVQAWQNITMEDNRFWLLVVPVVYIRFISYFIN